MNKNISEKAAKWWADQLRGNAKLDHGDTSETGMMTFMMATILQSKEKTHQQVDQINKFECELEKIIRKMKDNYNIIRVDYDPDYILCEAAEKAKLTLGMTTLPWKTTMWITEEEVKVACGYGASPEKI